MARLLLIVCALLAIHAAADTASVKVNPIQKIIELISSLQAKVIADGEAEVKAYRDFFEWCDDASKEKQNAITTGKGNIEDLQATIDKAASDIEGSSTKIEELSGAIGTNEADLKAAGLIREKEHADYTKTEAELSDTIDALGRAIKILEKHAALLQSGKSSDLKGIDGLAQTLGLLVDSAALGTHDKATITQLLQASSADKDSDEDMELGAPAAAVYEGHSGGIVSVLEDMLEKAENTLAQARKEEANSRHNYELLKLSLEDQVAADKKQMAETKKRKAAAEETKATAEGDLELAVKTLAEDQKTLKDMQMECMTQADEHENSVNSRKEELEALATAKKVIQKMTGGAEGRSYGMFLQMGTRTQSRSASEIVDAGKAAAKVVKRLAQRVRSVQLAQLSERMMALVHNGMRAGDDPFAKVKGLITDMIDKLLREAEEEASHKAFCDKEMSETKKAKEALEATVEKLTTRIDEAVAQIATLKEEIAALQAELKEMARLAVEMQKNREEENAAFLAAQSDLEMGVQGVQMALKVLRDYYAESEAEALLQNPSGEEAFASLMQQPKAPTEHSKSSGAAGGIIGMLEVAESDFEKNLAETRSAEEEAQAEYDRVVQDMKVTKATKEQDVRYKTKEQKSLEKYVSDTSADREGTQTELDAILEYYDKLKPQCIAKPEPYEERKRRREEEIAGLKEALTILEGEEVALLQTGVVTSRLRGIRRA